MQHIHALIVDLFTTTGVDDAKVDIDALDKETIPPSATLFVSNLPHNATGTTLKAVFEGCENANVVMDSGASRNKGQVKNFIVGILTLEGMFIQYYSLFHFMQLHHKQNHRQEMVYTINGERFTGIKFCGYGFLCQVKSLAV